MHNQGSCSCCLSLRLHNVCIDDLGANVTKSFSCGSVQGFECETDNATGKERADLCYFTDGILVWCGYQCDLESCLHRYSWTNFLMDF
jgi:hypothetical protein